MKKNTTKFIIFLFFIALFCASARAQNISGIINIYTPVTSISPCNLTVLSSAGFSVGDKVLIIQMKGATIDITNTAAFGTVLNYNNCGNYEFGTIQAIVGNTITLQFSLIRTYTIADMVQMIRVPVYNSATITGTLTAQTWSAATGTGGVLVFIDNGTTLFNADIDVKGKGFQGTTSQTINWQGCAANYIEPAASIEAAKGENIAILGPTYVKGIAAPANGGGGGLTDNGGGGASNYGAGGFGGKDGWQPVVCGNPAQGGKPLTYTNALNKIFLGGAGGDAQRSEGPGINMGAHGGGIVIIRSNAIDGNNRNILAQGLDGVNTIQDGGGGGGGGGVVLLECTNFPTTININTTGGKGGNANIYTGVQCSGGGGAGGGTLWVSTAAVNANINYVSLGGLGGLSQPPAIDGDPGFLGGFITNLLIPQSTIPGGFTTSSQNATICTGGSYVLPGGGSVSAAGAYYDTINLPGACDSLIITNLTVIPFVSSLQKDTICTGTSFILPSGTPTNTAGTYTDTITLVGGCDSIITSILTVTPPSTFNQNASICIGMNYTLPSGTSVNTGGTYLDTLTSTSGCDSIITTVLSVTTFVTSSQNPIICTGNNFILPDGTPVSFAGTYLDTINLSGGCDSIITTILSVTPPNTFSQNVTICTGTSYMLPGGKPVNTAGTYTDTITLVGGCDSIITTILTVTPPSTFSQNASICLGMNYTLPSGTPVNTAGTYIDTLAAAGGCDSIITTVLSVTTFVTSSQNPIICTGNNFILPDGTPVSFAGTYLDTINLSGGCDSIITTILSVTPPNTFSQNVTICTGTSYMLPGGNPVNTAGTYKDTVSTSSGCDSIITTIITVKPNLTSNQNAVICAGNNYILPGGIPVTIAGIYIDTVLSSQGCDSIITTNLAVKPNASSSQNPVICSGETFVLPGGSTATTTGVYTNTITAYNGCDSTVTTNLLVNTTPVAGISPDITIIEGNNTTLIATGGTTYSWSPSIGLDTTAGNTVIASPIQTTTYCVIATSNGCADTICVVVNVEKQCPKENNLAVPTAFSPNNDNVNDAFCLQGWERCLKEFSIRIYDRWGEKVFESEQPDFCWDGKYNGSMMDAQVFVYYIKAIYNHLDKAVNRKGNISLIR